MEGFCVTEFGSSIKRPFAEFKKFLIGTLVSIVPIVNFAGIGYGLECAATASRRNFALPSWSGFGRHWVRGLLGLIITLLYMLVPGLVMFLGMGNPVFLVLGGILAVLFMYVAFAGLIAYAIEDRFGAAFDFGHAFRTAFTGKWFAAFIVTLLVGIVLGAVGALANYLLAFTVVVPFIVGGLVSWIGTVAVDSILGSAYGELHGAPSKRK